MGTYSQALRKSVSNQTAPEGTQGTPKNQEGAKLASPGMFTLIFGIALAVVLAVNIHLIWRITEMAKEKERRVSHFFSNAAEDLQALENVREQIASAAREIAEFRTTLDLSNRKLKEADSRMSRIVERLDGLDFNIHNIVKAKDLLYSKVTKLELTASDCGI